MRCLNARNRRLENRLKNNRYINPRNRCDAGAIYRLRFIVASVCVLVMTFIFIIRFSVFSKRFSQLEKTYMFAVINCYKASLLIASLKQDYYKRRDGHKGDMSFYAKLSIIRRKRYCASHVTVGTFSNEHINHECIRETR